MKNYVNLFLSGVLMFILMPDLSKASTGGRGGIPDGIDEKSFTSYILGYGLRTSVQSYYNSVVQNLNTMIAPMDPGVANLLRAMIGEGLGDDIVQLNLNVGLQNCIKSGDESNPEYKNKKPRAWTQTGQMGIWNIGGKICFDVKGLVNEFKGLSNEEAAVRFTALTFHELTHHFQNATTNPIAIQRQEEDANTVGAYVEAHRRVGFQPVVTWAKSAESVDLNKPILSRLGQSEYSQYLHVQGQILDWDKNPRGLRHLSVRVFGGDANLIPGEVNNSYILVLRAHAIIHGILGVHETDLARFVSLDTDSDGNFSTAVYLTSDLSDSSTQIISMSLELEIVHKDYPALLGQTVLDQKLIEEFVSQTRLKRPMAITNLTIQLNKMAYEKESDADGKDCPHTMP